jgi:hypothetical protein
VQDRRDKVDELQSTLAELLTFVDELLAIPQSGRALQALTRLKAILELAQNEADTLDERPS